ncbi:tetratricopeptide repeat protein [Pelagicoccus sp. SDUM812003]|uniref:tetratricopeptide repeat protein n=1 Tax=Pelagicoccus sp. SDUM812003 TaxID=3041267 RepID=UPI00280DA7D7|nr:tetratricopeptide repeat protein [Pelagicoccus sp. SDUM812003]MDQ8205095.1 tetratricopeptide repeat protein [Pelagicoccus sp. SDUM812003]
MKTQRFQDLVSKNPDNELFRFSLAQALIEEDRHEEAIEHLDTCIQKKPDWMVAEILKGKSLLALQRPTDAKQTLERALQLAVEQHHETPEAEVRKLLADL